MNKFEKDFLLKKAGPAFEDYRVKLLQKLFEKESLFKEAIQKTLKDLAIKTQERQQLDATYYVAYIHFSPLQIGLLNENYEVLAEAYSQKWYQEPPIATSLYIAYLFEGIEEIKKELYQEVRKYMGKIKPCCLDALILKELKEWNLYFSNFMLRILKQWDEQESFLKMPKADKLLITWGEYKNQYDIVYQYENKVRSADDLKIILETGHPKDLVFSMWHDLVIKDMHIQLKDMSCSSFKKATFENIVFKDCQLIGINFKQAHLKGCHFIHCDLRTSDLSESVLENIVFENCEMTEVLFEKAVSKDVRVIK